MQHVMYLYSKLQKQTVTYSLSIELCSAAEAPGGKAETVTGAQTYKKHSFIFSLPLCEELSNYYSRLCNNDALRKTTVSILDIDIFCIITHQQNGFFIACVLRRKLQAVIFSE